MVTPRQAQLENLSGDVTGSGSGNDVVKLTGSAGVVNAQTARIANMSNPIGPQDAATKDYVDTQIGANDTLKEVLSHGNVTDGYNIVISNGDFITATGNDLNITTTESGGYAPTIDLIASSGSAGVSPGFVNLDGGDGDVGGGGINIRAGDASAGIGGTINLTAGTSNAFGSASISLNAGGNSGGGGGNISINAGPTTNVGSTCGHLNLNAGSSVTVGTTGGNADLFAGNGVDQGGSTYVWAGAGYRPGDISILGGAGTGLNNVGGDVTINSGYNGLSSGNVLLASENGSTGGSGSVTVQTGTSTGTASGLIHIKTGSQPVGAGGTGSITIETGSNPSGGGTGSVTVRSGAQAGSGTGSGTMTIETGSVFGGAPSGSVTIQTGTQLSPTGGGSGIISLITGNVSSSNSGGIYITTGNAKASVGILSLTTGSCSNGPGGSAQVMCGDCTGAISAPGGSFIVVTGDGYLGAGGGRGGDLTLTTGAGYTNGGNISVISGNSYGTGGYGGNISILAGDGYVAGGDGGDISIIAGDSGFGSQSGSVTISSGVPGGSASSSSVYLQSGISGIGYETKLEIHSAGIRPYDDISFYNEFSTPTITQDRLAGTGFGQDGYELIIRAQDAGGNTGDYNGGCLSLCGGTPINGGNKGVVAIYNGNNPTADFSYISAAADYGLYLNAGIVSSGTGSLSVWAVDKVADIGSDNASYNFLSFDAIYDAQILAGDGAFDRGRNIEIISGSGDDGSPGGDLTLQSGVLGAGSSDGYVIFKVGASEAARFNLDKTLHFSDGVNSTVAPDNFCIWGNTGNPYAAIACRDGYVFNLTLSLCDSLSNWVPTIDGYGGVAETTVSTVTGAVVGDSVLVTPDPLIEAGIILCGWVSSDNTVTVRATNTTAETITMASPTTHRIVVFHTPVFPPPP